MKNRSVYSHKKNRPFIGTRDFSHGNNPTAFFSKPAQVYSIRFERIFDEYTNELSEDWTFLGESEDWELISKSNPSA